MAIIQISKIQQRSGNLVDLPQLDGAQLGWANDARRLFIGRGEPYDPENIEVLTSYSNISFSQVEGSGGSNVNITASNLHVGQILGYDSSLNSWVNTGGNADSPSNTAQYTGLPIHLGPIANVKIGGGATGYVLETDGQGNLNWTSKGSLYTNITGLTPDASNTFGILANAVVMRVANTTPYTNGSYITITGVNGVSNSSINSNSFYIKLANDFPTSGNTILFTTSDLANANAVVIGSLTYTNPPNAIATSSLTGGGGANAGGSVNTIQFNDSGVLNGSANFTITSGNIVSLTGNFSASNIAGGNLVSANYFTGTLTTAAQPNITSTGTLAGLVVAGNITPSANITYNLGNNTNRFNDLYLANSTIYIGAQTISANATSVIVSGNLVANIIGNVSGNVTTAGTVTTAAQPNITSVGTLTSLSVSGNANIGNIGTGGLITATGNLNAGNIITAGILSVTGNATVGNISATTHTGTTVSVTGNVTGGNLTTGGLITATGNITGGNINGTFYGAGTGLTSIPGANVSGTVPYANIANSVAVANVSGIGNIATINKDGNASNILYGNGVFASAPTPGVSYGNSNVATFLASYGSNTISTTGNITAGNVLASNFVGSGVGSPTINSSGSLSISATSGVTINNLISFSTGSNTTAGNITGNFTLTSGSRLQATYADLAEYYEADAVYAPGTILEFGGDKEVTIAEDGTARVAGVVSTNPAYAMNANCKGIATAIALQGRVPTKVRGAIRKGDMMISAGNGYARPCNTPLMGTVIGKALENFDGIEGIIEIAVGRL